MSYNQLQRELRFCRNSLRKKHMWSGYSVDTHGSYCAGGSLRLWTKDPKKRPLWRVPGRFEKKELEHHLVELFPEGLSRHGWRHMLDRHDFLRDPITNDAFVNHTWQVEFTFEMVRRAAFPKINSRFQSYFAWETLEQETFERKCRPSTACKRRKDFVPTELVDARSAGRCHLIVRSPILVWSRFIGSVAGNCAVCACSHS